MDVTSADGTVIGYRTVGSGPALIAVHGGMLSGADLMRLADALASRFTVHLPDRRGRGLSGPGCTPYQLKREVEDLRALVDATGASRAFGLSTGALVVLRTALETPELQQIALYEPPLSVAGSVPLHWFTRFEHECAEGKLAAALVTVLQGLDVEPVLGRIPRAVLVPLFAVSLRMRRSIAALVPTERQDVRAVEEMADTAGDYATLNARVLLLGGTKSPAYLQMALDALEAVLPHATRTTLAGLDHSAPVNDGDPKRVAAALHDFYVR